MALATSLITIVVNMRVVSSLSFKSSSCAVTRAKLRVTCDIGLFIKMASVSISFAIVVREGPPQRSGSVAAASHGSPAAFAGQSALPVGLHDMANAKLEQGSALI